MTDHLRDAVGIHHLVAEILRAVGAAAAVTCHRTVNHDHVYNLVVVCQFLVIPVEMPLYVMNVADVEFILEVAVRGRTAFPRKEVALSLAFLVGDMQFDGILQRIGIVLCHITPEVPRDGLQNVQ